MKVIFDMPDKMWDFINKKRPNGYFNVFDVFDAYTIGKCIRNGTPLPDNATNGDMIKALFDCKVVEETHSTYVVNMGKDYFWKNFEKSWWNAPYKKGEE